MQTTLHAVKISAVADAAESHLGALALWHLLSLDAPAVAALWTWFAARTVHAPLTPVLPVAMFLAVWLLYATDRLLDCRNAAEELEPRHHFHREHRRAFIAAIAAVSLGLGVGLHEIPAMILRRYYLLAGLLLLWFAAIHLVPRRRTLPKEIVPGPFFAAAIFLPIFSTAMIPAAAAFALLCILNCLSIYAWEHPETVRAPSIAPLRWVGTPHGTTRHGIRFLTAISILAIVLPLALIPATPAFTPILVAISLAAALLFGLNRFHRSLDPTNLRAAADLVLLTPLLIAPFLR